MLASPVSLGYIEKYNQNPYWFMDPFEESGPVYCAECFKPPVRYMYKVNETKYSHRSSCNPPFLDTNIWGTSFNLCELPQKVTHFWEMEVVPIKTWILFGISRLSCVFKASSSMLYCFTWFANSYLKENMTLIENLVKG